MTEPSKEAVCVTGANGFIGSWLVQTLLTTGYTTIHATIYPGSDPSHLFTLQAASKANLKVFEADILDDVAVSRAVEGCTGVFHVASPCTLEDPQDPQKELVLPAVQGTLNVLEAAKKFKARRMVLTSSISALVPNPGWPQDKVFDETSWTDLDYCKSRQKWYPVSKTLAEKVAWEFAEKNGIDVVAIHPATCLDTQEYHWLGAVHVKDVAKAQVLLFESPAASGRYLCTNGIYQFGEFAERVSKLFPKFPVHRNSREMPVAGVSQRNRTTWRFNGETQPGLVSCKDAAKRLMNLGLVFSPVEDAVSETVESLKAKGCLVQKMSHS
ncbi:hypothetical protein Patl1_36652 [Pistacia atlantica]|nr:hypothetical protein Patl1_36652 [Pistacia atlantica]